jgi:hypothetical protein
MYLKKPRPVYRFVLFACLAALTLSACNNKKKDDKETKKDTMKVSDTVVQKPTAPGDKMAPAVDTVKQKPTAPGD